jgi:(1->4)-alpha-D-glucan 1-alpha-D-glucosylmutase
VKLAVLRALLDLRRRDPVLFEQGEYVPLETRGPLHEHVVGWARQFEDRWVVGVVPRLTLARAEPDAFATGSFWSGTSVVLPTAMPEELVDVFSGEVLEVGPDELPMAAVLDRLPVAVLVGDTGRSELARSTFARSGPRFPSPT